MNRRSLPLSLVAASACLTSASGEDAGVPPVSARFAVSITPVSFDSSGVVAHRLVGASMYAVSEPPPRTFLKHDLIQILVQETSSAGSAHELDTEKKQTWQWNIGAFPMARPQDLPQLDMGQKRKFEGSGEYAREDEFTARLTAEVIAIRPNGNLVLEARTQIKTDTEQHVIKVTGECRRDDVSTANTVVSNRLHDLNIEKINTGELPRANERGIITQLFDLLFAF